MSIMSALSSALSGLNYAQRSLAVTSSNIANADSEGYTKKILNGTPLYVGDHVSGVSTGAIQRTLDTFLQKQARTQTSGLQNAEILTDYYKRIDVLFGKPGGSNAIDTIYNKVLSSLEKLSTSPESSVERQNVLSKSKIFAQHLNQMASDIISMRENTEREIGVAVRSVNDLLGNIRTTERQIQSQAGTGNIPADLLDQRDIYIDRLSELIDIRVQEQENGAVSIMTGSGVLLYDYEATTLEFDEVGSFNAASKWSADSSERTVGTIRINDGNGLGTDLITSNAIRSGKIAGLLELRDEVLVDLQSRLDELAHSMSLAMSNKTVTGSAVTVGSQSGSAIDISGLQPGNTITLNYVENGETKTISIMRVDDASQLPLDDTATARSDDTVIGIDFSGGPAATATAINAALGGTFSVSNPSGSTLQFLTSGSANAASTGVNYGTNGSTLTLGALNGQTMTVDVNGTPSTFTFTATTTGANVQAFLSGLANVNASISGGDLTVAGDTSSDIFSINYSSPAVAAALGLSSGDYSGSENVKTSASITETDLQNGGTALPFFVDGLSANSTYTGSLDGGSTKIGYASRITLNPALLDDPSKLVIYKTPANAVGDASRPKDLIERLSNSIFTFDSATGIGSKNNAYSSTIGQFTREIINRTATESTNAVNRKEGQEIVVNNLNTLLSEESGVDIDNEIARLSILQNYYAANARIISIAQEMVDLLIRL